LKKLATFVYVMHIFLPRKFKFIVLEF